MIWFFMEMESDNLFRYNMKISVCEMNNIKSKQMLKMCQLTKRQVAKHAFKWKSKASATILFSLKISLFRLCLIFWCDYHWQDCILVWQSPSYSRQNLCPVSLMNRGTQVFRYPKVSTPHKNVHTESVHRSPSSLMCSWCCLLIPNIWGKHVLTRKSG